MRSGLNRSGKIGVLTLVMLSFVHWDCSAFFNISPPPQLKGGYPVEVADGVQADQNTGYVPNAVAGCADIPSGSAYYTQPTLWNFQYTDGSGIYQPIYWPKGGSGQSPYPILLWDDPQNQSNVYNEVQGAAQTWENQLSSRAPGNLLVSLTVSGNNSDEQNANILVYDDTEMYLQQDKYGTVAGNQNFLNISNNYANLTLSQIVLKHATDPSTLWVASLHEIGHALGLNHSRYQRSVMFPDTTNCVSYPNQNLDYADLGQLFHAYDPRWKAASDNGGDPPTCRPGRICAMVGGPLPYSVVPRGQRSGPFPSYGMVRTLFDAPSNIPNHPRAHWVAVEDLGHSATLSPDSLWLSSSLVARVHIKTNVIAVTHKPTETLYQAAAVEQIYKQADGPDADVRDGDTILIAQTQEANGDEFLDDLTLHPADGSALVFVRALGGHLKVGTTVMPIHGFTSDYVSKYAVSGSAPMAPFSDKGTLLRSFYNSKSVYDALSFATVGSSAVSAVIAKESDSVIAANLSRSLFTRNGITSSSDLAAYRNAITSNPFLYYQDRSKADLQRYSGLLTNPRQR